MAAVGTVARYLEWFAQQHKALVGCAYVTAPRDEDAAAALLGSLDKRDLMHRTIAFLSTNDPFISSRARTVSMLRSVANDPAVTYAKPSKTGVAACAKCGSEGSVEYLPEQKAACPRHGGESGLARTTPMRCTVCQAGGFTGLVGSECMDCAFEGLEMAADDPRRLLWEKTVKMPSIVR